MSKEVAIAREGDVSPLNVVRDKGQREARNLALYRHYTNDPNYKDVYFDNTSGGMMAVHNGHNWEHNAKDGTRYFGDMTKEDLEKEFAREVVRMGSSAIFRDESKRRADGSTAVALDVVVNGRLTDIRSVTENNRSYKNQLESKNNQLRGWNAENPSEKGRTVTLYFHEPSMYSEAKIKRSIKELKKTVRNGHRTRLEFNKVLAVVKGHDRIYEFDA